MSKSLWACYEDALKLILTGTTNKSLSSDQRVIFETMLTQGVSNASSNQKNERCLPGVQTQQHCVNKAKQKYEVRYYIPDLFRYMLETFQEWSILAPPVDLDYLNSLHDESGKSLFMFSSAPGYKAWEESQEGEEYWSMICRKSAIKKEISELERTHHGGDPLKLEAQKRMRIALNVELAALDNEITSKESPSKGGNRDHNLQDAANRLASKWIQDKRTKITVRKIAEELSISDEWKEMKANRIERIICKEW